MSNNTMKVLMVGYGGCGKCHLKNVFSSGMFSGLPRFDSPVVSMEVDDELVDLALHYPQGGEDFDRMRPLSYVQADVFLIFFSISSPSSLKKVAEIFAPEIKKFAPGVPIVLVGNKKDLRNDDATRRALAKSKQEPVKTEEGRAMAEKIGAYAYLECTAKFNEGVREVFETAIRAVLAKQSKKRCCRCTIS